MQETSLVTIEQSAKAFATDRAALSEAVSELNASIEDLKRRALPRIRRLVAAAALTQSNLMNHIRENPQLFIKPRTYILHGIKLGLHKGAGGIDWDEDQKVVNLIRKHLPKSQADLLIKVTERPLAKALGELDVATLKRIGCRVEETGDQIVIKPADSDVDNLVSALLATTIDSERPEPLTPPAAAS